ncbi:MAG TPA: anti-sigma factor [Steroidobacteraceae bacterium]
MGCAESLQVQAYFDGETDAAGTAAIERHLETCAECRVLLKELEQGRALIRSNVKPLTAPMSLRGRIMDALGQEALNPPLIPSRRARARPFWIGVLSGVGGSAVAAALAMLIIAPIRNNRLENELVAEHTLALMSSHLIDVVSTDQHTVKPWFAGRVDISPVVADFASQGYRLVGGRVDDLGRRRAAVVVYRHGAHVINVFSWAITSGRVPPDTTRNGYHLAFWKAGNLGYCAVSDTAWGELQTLVNLLREQGARDVPP